MDAILLKQQPWQSLRIFRLLASTETYNFHVFRRNHVVSWYILLRGKKLKPTEEVSFIQSDLGDGKDLRRVGVSSSTVQEVTLYGKWIPVVDLVRSKQRRCPTPLPLKESGTFGASIYNAHSPHKML